METGIILFVTISFCLIIGIIGLVFLKKSHKKQKAEYPKHLEINRSSQKRWNLDSLNLKNCD